LLQNTKLRNSISIDRLVISLCKFPRQCGLSRIIFSRNKGVGTVSYSITLNLAHCAWTRPSHYPFAVAPYTYIPKDRAVHALRPDNYSPPAVHQLLPSPIHRRFSENNHQHLSICTQSRGVLCSFSRVDSAHF